MLQAAGLSYTADPRFGPLFEDITLSILPGEKVALMGPNGAGKTKLLQILAGMIPPAQGQVIQTKKTSVGYLPQDFDFEFAGTLEEMVGDHPLLARYLGRFGLVEKLEQRYDTLSLGERMRAALAKLLVTEPDILLLDEPTNHLDLEARIWLEEFLRRCPQGVLMVCHDRTMINAVVSRVLDLRQGCLTEYGGGYDDMLRQKHERFERDRAAHAREQAETRRLKTAAEHSHQRASNLVNKSKIRDYDPKGKPHYNARAKAIEKQAKSMRTRIEHLNRKATEKPFLPKDAALEFPSRPLRSDYPLAVRKLTKSYTGPLFEGLNFNLEKGYRTALVGANGSGKTTLMRILLGQESPDSGEIVWSPDAVVGYLSQSRGLLPHDLTVLEALDPITPEEEKFARTLLGRLLFRGDAVHKPVGVLSVGERTKVELTKMLLSPANVLLLDEPTNHLDVESLEALEKALLEYPGCVIFTSHDRTFVETIADEVLAFEKLE